MGTPKIASPHPNTGHAAQQPTRTCYQHANSAEAANIYKANTYEQLWPLFESGTITVPDTFTRLYLTDQTNNSVHFLRSVVMGFAMSRCIMQAANISQHDINVFLIMLTIHKRQHPLNNGLWESYLQESMMPDQRSGTAPPPAENNWSEARHFANHPATQEPAYGLTFIPPQNAHEPWAICMQWTADDFMWLIHHIQPH